MFGSSASFFGCVLGVIQDCFSNLFHPSGAHRGEIDPRSDPPERALCADILLAMLAVVAVAIPMYICATGSIPIALSLMLKGLSPGIAFVMLMAGPAANFASVMILRRTQGTRATAIYVGSVVLTAIAFGLVIDLLLPASWFVPAGAASGIASCHIELSWFDTLCSVLLAGLSYIRPFEAAHIRTYMTI